MSTEPTTEPLLTISAFARAVDLPPSTLRRRKRHRKVKRLPKQPIHDT